MRYGCHLRHILPIVSTAVLIADLLEPGHFKFFDLPFAVQARWSPVHLEPIQRIKTLAPTCQQLHQHPKQLNASIVLSQQLPGQSEQDLLTQLGPPACRIAEEAYQWTLDSGMTLQMQIKRGEVSHVKISDPAIH